MTIYKVPLQNISQKFLITLGTIDYYITLKWNNSIDAGWVLDFDDANTSTSLVANIPLVTGINILSGLDYLGFQGQLFIYTDGDQNAVPTFENLGVESNLYFQTSV